MDISIQALLLGYTEISIILYELYQYIVSHRVTHDDYVPLLNEYINKHTLIMQRNELKNDTALLNE